jgi:acetyl-CoA acetyltransferase
MDKHFQSMAELRGFSVRIFITPCLNFKNAPGAAQLFGNAGKEHMDKYGTTATHFAKIGYKNHKHSVNNPYAQFQQYVKVFSKLTSKGSTHSKKLRVPELSSLR